MNFSRSFEAAKTGYAVVAVLLAALPSVAQNLALNPGFESGTTSWFSTGPATLTSPTAQSHSGSRSGVLVNRTDAWNGIHQSVLGVLQPTNTYKISAWVRLVGGGNQPVLLTMQKTDGGGTTYTTVASGTATATNWTQLNGGYTLNISGTLTSLSLHMEGPRAGVSFYADDFLVENNDWKTLVNARIEQVRKRNVQLLIVDAAGNPVPGGARPLLHNPAARRRASRFNSNSQVMRGAPLRSNLPPT